tara:strand:+ start:132 stop:389 length:258 start_codon:yes stop_codon:yes gene_type:complete
MRYREHKGGLAESLKTEIKIDSKFELLKHLNKQYNSFNKTISKLKFKHIGIDDRTGWNTYYVLIKLKGDDYFSVIGMSDSNNFIV